MFDQLMKVSRGFRLVYIGMIIVILGILGGVLGSCIGAGVVGAGGGGGGVGLLLLVVAAMLVCILGGSITGLVGRFFCLAVPERAGSAKTMIFISVALELMALGLGIANSLTDFARVALPPAAKIALSGGNVLASLASAVMFLLFTKSLARFIKRRDLADTAMSVLWLWITTIACYAFGIIVMIVGGIAAGGANAGVAGVACFGLVFTLVSLIIALVALIRYIGLLKEMCDATAQHARRVRKSKRREVEDEDEDEDEDDDDDDDDYRRRRAR